MRFRLIDQIVEAVPGQRLRAAKNLTLGEEYLADHFPSFPVMPGVLMLESLVQAGAWLVRLTEDFGHSVIVLREVRGVKYGNFVAPGSRLDLTVEIVEKNTQNSATVAFKGNGEVGGVASVSARFALACYNLREKRPDWAGFDDKLIREFRDELATLRPSRPVTEGAS
jgi:3-hydroxyacyl-[acyl-carrier-protein] dehydratase